MDAKFIVITPARNEATHIGETIRSILSQTILPCQWIIVDDGSTDATANIAETTADNYSWIKVVRRKDRGYRDVNSGAVEAFYAGLSEIRSNDYKFIFMIEADIFLEPDYFKIILGKFKENPNLGIAVGDLFDNFDGKLFRRRGLPLGTSGPIKCWRRSCFEEIGGIVKGIGYDALDCFKALSLGWKAQTFRDQSLKVTHLRPTGSSIVNIYHGWARHGKAHHFIGGHPIWLLASSFYHMIDPPYFLGGICIIIGYLDSLLSRKEQYGDYKFRRILRKWQLSKLYNILRHASLEI